MEILWLVIGVILGLVVAWFFLNARCRTQLSEQEARLSESSRRVEQALEQSTTQQIASLSADLDASRQQLESVKADAAEKSANLAQLQSQSDELKARLDVALKKAQDDRDTAIDDSKSQIASLEARLRDREEAIAPLEAELAELRAKFEGPTHALSPEIGSELVSASHGDAASTVASDDLTKIKGIGPVLKEKLHGLGITSFQQIADFTQADVDRANKVLDFPGRIEREQWIKQAKAIVNGGTEEGKG